VGVVDDDVDRAGHQEEDFVRVRVDLLHRRVQVSVARERERADDAVVLPARHRAAVQNDPVIFTGSASPPSRRCTKTRERSEP